MKKDRRWQLNAYEILDKTISSDKTELVSMPACVGSGKTRTCIYGFGKFIMENRDFETVQFFVSPRIKLCDQQSKEISDNLYDLFGFTENKDYKIIPIDCTKDEFNKKDAQLVNEAKHTIFVICDCSLWGIDKQTSDPAIRFHRWINAFKKWQNEGKRFGCIVFDEAHNYHRNQMQMFGEEKY